MRYLGIFMPELPEVEAVCRKLSRDLQGSRLLSACIERPRTAYPQNPLEITTAISGRKVMAIRRRGKHILIDLDGELVMHVHLRMTGNLYVVPDCCLRPSTTRAWFALHDGRGLVFDDPRALGVIHLHPACEMDAKLPRLGLEPLEAGFTEESFLDCAKRSRRPIKLLLMDQSQVVGLGNIYAAEALFRAHVLPTLPANRISHSRLAVLHRTIVEVLRDAVESAYRAYNAPGRFVEGEDYPLAVYGREGEPCLICGCPVRRIAQGGRSTYYCPGCQK